MLVVADTSPLNYLVWIGLADVLPTLYGRVVVPPEVRAELLAKDAPTVVRAWANDLPSWIEIRGAKAYPPVLDAALGDAVGARRGRRLKLGPVAEVNNLVPMEGTGELQYVPS